LNPTGVAKRIRHNWARGIVLGLGGWRRCPVCRGLGLPIRASWMHAHLRCRRCDLIYVADLPSRENLVAAYQRVHLDPYQVQHKQQWQAWMQHKELTLDRLRIAAPAGSRRALDVGCGEGRMMLVLRQRGWEVEGLELNDVLARQARELGLNVTTTAVEHASPAGRYQLITMSHLLEHVRQPLQVLRQVHRWIEPGGLLVLETPLSPDFDNIDHLYCFSPAALILALQRTGFAPHRFFDYVDDNYHHHNLACVAHRM